MTTTIKLTHPLLHIITFFGGGLVTKLCPTLVTPMGHKYKNFITQDNGEAVEETDIHDWWECKLVQLETGKYISNLQMYLPCHPEIPCLSMYPVDMLKYV